MITDARLNAGLPPLGFLGPRLYSNAKQFPGEAFTDITKGAPCFSFSAAAPPPPLTTIRSAFPMGVMVACSSLSPLLPHQPATLDEDENAHR
jgi:hypothetical protein